MSMSKQVEMLPSLLLLTLFPVGRMLMQAINTCHEINRLCVWSAVAVSK